MLFEQTFCLFSILLVSWANAYEASSDYLSSLDIRSSSSSEIASSTQTYLATLSGESTDDYGLLWNLTIDVPYSWSVSQILLFESDDFYFWINDMHAEIDGVSTTSNYNSNGTLFVNNTESGDASTVNVYFYGQYNSTEFDPYFELTLIVFVDWQVGVQIEEEIIVDSNPTSTYSTTTSSSSESESKTLSSSSTSSSLKTSKSESSSESKTLLSSSSATSSSSSESSVSSSSSSALPTAPTVDGSIVDGYPVWTIVIPGTLGEYSGLELTLDCKGPVVCNNAQAILNGDDYDIGTIEVQSSSVSIAVSNNFTVTNEDEITIYIGGIFTAEGTATINGFLSINKDLILEKRDDSAVTYSISYSIKSTADTIISSSSSESGTSNSSSGTALSGSTSSGATSETTSPSENTTVSFATSTKTTADKGTTVITFTSCSDNRCLPNLSASTFTTHSESTELITIASCSDNKCSNITKSSQAETNTAGPETIVVIITSCSNNKCATTTKTSTIEATSKSSSVTNNLTEGGKSSSIGSTFEGNAQTLAVGSSIAAFVFALLFV